MDDVEFAAADDSSELLDVGARWQLPRWVVPSALAVAGAGVLVATICAPPVESGHGSRPLPPPPAHQAQLYQPLRGHFLL